MHLKLTPECLLSRKKLYKGTFFLDWKIYCLTTKYTIFPQVVFEEPNFFEITRWENEWDVFDFYVIKY